MNTLGMAIILFLRTNSGLWLESAMHLAPRKENALPSHRTTGTPLVSVMAKSSPENEKGFSFITSVTLCCWM